MASESKVCSAAQLGRGQARVTLAAALALASPSDTVAVQVQTSPPWASPAGIVSPVQVVVAVLPVQATPSTVQDSVAVRASPSTSLAPRTQVRASPAAGLAGRRVALRVGAVFPTVRLADRGAPRVVPSSGVTLTSTTSPCTRAVDRLGPVAALLPFTLQR